MAAPTGFTASTNQAHQIALAWDGAVGTEINTEPDTGYELERKVDLTTYELLYRGIDTSFVDTGLDDGVSQTYRLRSFTGGTTTQVNSEYTADLTGSTLPLPAAPTLSGTAGEEQNTLSWTVSATNLTGVRLYRDEVLLYEGIGTSFTDVELVNDIPYAYVAAAFNAAGEARSAVLTLTPKGVATAQATTKTALSPYLRHKWIAYVLSKTTSLRVGGVGGPTATVESLQLRSSVLINTAPIPVSYTGTTVVEGLNAGNAVIWQTDQSLAIAGVIPTGELCVRLEDS